MTTHINKLFIMAGKYYYLKGGSSEVILKDTLIEEIIDIGEYLSVKVKGFNYGSFAVFNRKKILKNQRIRKIVFRKKPCHCKKFGFLKTEWMVGVPIYCKIVNDGGSCKLIKQTGNLFYCNYEKSPVKDYIKLCTFNEIEVEHIKIYL